MGSLRSSRCYEGHVTMLTCCDASMFSLQPNRTLPVTRRARIHVHFHSNLVGVALHCCSRLLLATHRLLVMRFLQPQQALALYPLKFQCIEIQTTKRSLIWLGAGFGAPHLLQLKSAASDNASSIHGLAQYPRL